MEPSRKANPERLDSVDCLRGLVIVLMALDHTRDFFGRFSLGGPESAALATPALFFTRWITHFCAPTFVLLAGLGAFLSRTRGTSKVQLSGFLLSRGMWLVVLELTIVHFGWSLDWDLRRGMWQVIWAIGWSMVGLSLLTWTPTWLVGLLGWVIIAGHNAFDGLTGAQAVAQHPWIEYVLGERGWLWDLLHNANRPFSPAPGYVYWNLYPVLPWFGVLCAGYGLGPLMSLEGSKRRRALLTLGTAAGVAFVVLRYSNLYGDPTPWRAIPGGGKPADGLRTTMSFLACTKYPPSLLFLLMTLGPSLVFLALLERPVPYLKAFFVTFGRVPLFFYIIHLPVIHSLARAAASLRRAGYDEIWFIPVQTGYDLPGIYVLWVVVVLALYLPCLAYGRLKRRFGGLLRYL